MSAKGQVELLQGGHMIAVWGADSGITATAVLERVNGWDALVAENDRLRAALEDVVVAADAVGIDYRAGDGIANVYSRLDEATEAARAALEGGKA